jgi:DNA-binding response OmpR family regulator
MDELVARVNVQLKNNNNVKDKNIIEYADLMLNISNSKLTCIKTNESVELVCKEFQLLEYFMNNSEQILSKEQIYDKIWGIENISSSNNLEAYLSFLRKKIKAIGSCVNIKSVRGLGYRMEKVNEKIKK